MLYSSLGHSGAGSIVLGAPSPAIRSLQQALAGLARVTGDARLAAGGVDGLFGPKTLTAANLALSQYATSAPANLRTGRLTSAQVQQNATKIQNAIIVATNARAGARPAPRAAAQSAPGARSTPQQSQAVLALQQALRRLGAAAGDQTLVIGADGRTGPKTAAAVNRAFTKYIPAASSPPEFRTGKLTAANVAVLAARLAPLVERAAVARAAAPKPAPAPAPARAVVVQLQQLLRALSPLVNDRSLLIAADGLVGPGTQKAVNRALSKYVSEAPAQWRRGNLSVSAIKTSVAALIPHLQAAVSRLGRKKAAAPKKSAPAPRALVPVAKTSSRGAALALQQALNALSSLVNDSRVAVKADGIVGPATRDAVNYVFTKYVEDGEAPDQYRTGKLTIAAVVGAAGELAAYVQQEAARTQRDVENARAEESTAERAAAETAETEAAQRAASAAERPPVSPEPEPEAAPPSAEPAYAPPASTPASAYAPGSSPSSFAPPPSAPTASMPDMAAEEGGVAPLVPSAPVAPPAALPEEGGGDGGVLAPAPGKKPFPWAWVLGIGGGVLSVGLIAYFVFRDDGKRSGGGTRRRRRSSAPKAAPTAPPVATTEPVKKKRKKSTDEQKAA